tara:strand:+ start:68 stop:505 length:438 start_codon:yes stop_codon:yes gene_type:complete
LRGAGNPQRKGFIITKTLRDAAILAAILPLAAACATGEGETRSGGPDWSKSTTVNVKTGHGDRISFRVLGNEKDGFDYHARIRHTTRSDPDPIDRQRVLGEAARIVAVRIYKTAAIPDSPNTLQTTTSSSSRSLVPSSSGPQSSQ